MMVATKTISSLVKAGTWNGAQLVASESWDVGDGGEVTHGSQRPSEECKSSFEQTRSKKMKNDHQRWGEDDER
jgi:hypothetical protein